MAKQELLTAVKDDQHDSFLTLVQNHGRKRSSVNLQEVILELNRAQKNEIWTCLYLRARKQLTNLFDRVADGEQKEDPLQSDVYGAQFLQDPNNQEQSEPYNEELMTGIVEFACIFVNTYRDGDIFIPEKLLELAVLLHGVVRMLEGPLLKRVLSLCELWWLKQLEERDHIIVNVLPLLVDAATTKGAQKKDVIRLWSLRDALQVVNLDDSENKHLVKRLAACAASPIFLSCDEGIKWLAALFCWHFLIPHLHQAIKSILPECTKRQGEKYAEVYVRAWKNNEGTVKQVIEENCIQDLMYAAIHVNPMSGQLSANLHHLLHHIHRHKRHHAVATTIFNLYDPFLWRSLKAANGLVRMNATKLLCDAFPLTDSSLNHEERNNLLERQWQAIITLLMDPCHLVRITAIKGVYKILSEFWHMTSSKTIKTIFQKLLSDLIRDASSIEVRTEVIKGFTLLIDSRDAMPFLTEVLPRLRNVFDDIGVNVRVAFVKLLLKVKSSKVARYWDIVPMHHLLHGLASDKPVVCKLLTQLLFNSFHPLHCENQDLLNRTLTLLEENRSAARRFYQYASRKLDLPSTVSFMLLIWRCLWNFALILKARESSYDEESESSDNTSQEDQIVPNDGVDLKRTPQNRVPSRVGHDSSVALDDKENTGWAPWTQRSQAAALVKDTEPGKGSSNDGQAETEDNDGGGFPLDNPAVVGGLLDTIVILWTANAHRLALPQNLKYLEALRTRVSKGMPLFFKVFKENEDVSHTLLYLSSFLPRTLIPTLVGHCLSKLRALTSDQENEDSCATYIDALCNWNRSDDVIELASEWLEKAFKVGKFFNDKGRCGRVRFCETNVPQPLIALRLIKQILKHPLNKLSTLNHNRHLLLELTENMGKVKELISERLNRMEELSPLCSDVFLCECWAQYLILVIVLHKLPLEDQEPNEIQERDDGGENPDDLMFNSTAVLIHCLDWANSAVTPLLAEEISSERKLRSGDLAISVSVLNELIVALTHLIMRGAVDAVHVYKICAFVDGLLKKDTNGSFWQKSLWLALEAHEFLEVYDFYHEENEAVVNVAPVDMVNSCISSTSEYFKLHQELPENGKEMNDTLVKVLSSLGKNSQQYQNEVMLHIAATVVQHICWTVDKIKGVDTEVTKITDLDGCTSLLVGACQKQARLSTAMMNSIAHFIETSVHDITTLLAVLYLLTVLVSNSGNISRYSLKQAAAAADSIMSRIILPISSYAEENESGFSTGFYIEYAEKAKVLTEDLKSSLGVL